MSAFVIILVIMFRFIAGRSAYIVVFILIGQPNIRITNFLFEHYFGTEAAAKLSLVISKTLSLLYYY